MKSVWKYPLRIENEQVIRVPTGAKPLHVGFQLGQPYIWWMLTDSKEVVAGRTVKIRGTGHEIDFDLNQFQYVGTLVEQEPLSFVYHVWVEK
jgi:hypothetical protein